MLQGYDIIDGGRQYPSALLAISIQELTATKPTLVRHRSVVTMFHELGHGIHCLVGRTRFAETYGTKTSRDFVEIPNPMLENFCWDPCGSQKLVQALLAPVTRIHGDLEGGESFGAGST